MAEETNAAATEEPKQAQKPGLTELVLSKVHRRKENDGQEAKKASISWRHELPHDINSEINHLVKETHKVRDAYKKTLKVRDAQLWVAVASINKRLKVIEEQLGVQQV